MLVSSAAEVSTLATGEAWQGWKGSLLMDPTSVLSKTSNTPDLPSSGMTTIGAKGENVNSL